MGDVTKCKECGSSDLFWFAVNVNKSGIAEGRLRTHEVTCRFVLGCHNCSETLKTVDADRIAERMNSDRSELAALREELATSNKVGTAIGETLGRVTAERDDLHKRLTAAEQRNAELEALLDTPHTSDWFEGVKLEAGHQIKRWGSEHDAGKGPADWFWLIGYLAQKAMGAQMLGDTEKAKHHTISTGAALLNWFRAITGDSNDMRPGIDDAALKPTESGASE